MKGLNRFIHVRQLLFYKLIELHVSIVYDTFQLFFFLESWTYFLISFNCIQYWSALQTKSQRMKGGIRGERKKQLYNYMVSKPYIAFRKLTPGISTLVLNVNYTSNRTRNHRICTMRNLATTARYQWQFSLTRITSFVLSVLLARSCTRLRDRQSSPCIFGQMGKVLLSSNHSWSQDCVHNRRDKQLAWLLLARALSN